MMLILWEQIHNPDFKAIEFDRFKMQIFLEINLDLP